MSENAKLFNGDWSCFEFFHLRMDEALQKWSPEELSGVQPSTLILAGKDLSFWTEVGIPPWTLELIDRVASHAPDRAEAFMRELFCSITPDHEIFRFEHLFIAALIEDINIGVTNQLIPGFIRSGGRLLRVGGECQKLVLELASLHRKMAAGGPDASEGRSELARIIPQLCEIFFDSQKVDLVKTTACLDTAESKCFVLASKLAKAYVRQQQELAAMVNAAMYKDSPNYQEPRLLYCYWSRVGWLLQSAVYKGFAMQPAGARNGS